MADGRPVVELRDATLRLGDRTLWAGLDLDVMRGNFVAVLGPNGAGKTSLVRVLLGLQALTAGTVRVSGRVPASGDRRIGYLPQQPPVDRDLRLRGRDLVRLGLDGHRYGPRRLTRRDRATLDEAIAAVGAETLADSDVGRLSGGERQRLRIAQALVGRPELLLCDEPLASLDLRRQHDVVDLIDRRRRELDIPVLLVSHEINPLLPHVDRVLYLVGGRAAVGTPEEILTSERLSDLYGTRVDVVRVGDRVAVLGPGGEHHHDGSAPAWV